MSLGVAAKGVMSGLFIGGSSLLSLYMATHPEDAIPARLIVAQVVDGDDPRPDEQIAASPARIDHRNQNGDSQINALQQKVDRLKAGLRFLDDIPTYTAQMVKQEVVNGELLDAQVIRLKYRKKPFSVYLLWTTGDAGREVIYVDGQHDNRMWAHDGGWKARIPAFLLSPDSSLAMRDARYPVTAAGLQGLIDIMLTIHETELRDGILLSCEIDPDAEFDGRSCERFTIHYKNQLESPIYRKSVTWMDRKWSIPLKTRHYEWPESGVREQEDGNVDSETLLESYEFTDIDFDCALQDNDFSRLNTEYRFR